MLPKKLFSEKIWSSATKVLKVSCIVYTCKYLLYLHAHVSIRLHVYNYYISIISECKKIYSINLNINNPISVKRSCYFSDYQFRRPTTSSGLYNVIG